MKTSDNFSQVDGPVRPGISTTTLRAASVRFSNTPQPGSIEIPYFDLQGRPTGFSRWRLPHERPDGQKYHQKPNTGTRVYIPPQFHSLPPGGDLVIVEGEFKALALIDADIKTIGLPGFNTYVRGDRNEPHLLDGIIDCLNYTKPARVLFLGDRDTATNYEFARNANFLGAALAPLVVLLPRIPYSGVGKGIDDCREALGAKFMAFWHELVETAEQFDLKAGPGALAATLLEREAAAIKAMTGVERETITRRVVVMAAISRNEPLAQDRIKTFAANNLGYSRSAFNQAVKDALRDLAKNAQEGARPAIVCINESEENRSDAGATAVGDSEASEALTPNSWFKARFPKLVQRYGEPVKELEEAGLTRVIDVCEDFMAATLSEESQPEAPTIFLRSEDRFYSYEPTEGIFIRASEPELAARLSQLFLKCARDCSGTCDVSKLEFGFRDSASLGGILRRARALLAADDNFFQHDVTSHIAVANGMLRLADRVIVPWSPSHRRRNKLAIGYDPEARCPLFLDILMRPALPDDDINLVQRWSGEVLLGENLGQNILLLTGTAGGGKGVLARVIIGIIGKRNLAALRPGLLAERFELSRFIGRTLLYGADVPDNFLNQRSASVMKALTGGDDVTPEFKNSNEVPEMTCRFNILVVSNSRLTVRLEGDTDAWRRRLAVVRYTQPKTAHAIADLSERILREEGAGVLNWMLDGLDQARSANWELKLNDRQQRIVDDLLLESDGHGEFVRGCMAKDATSTVLVNDAYAAYVNFCDDRGWAAVSRNQFGKIVPDIVVQKFRLPVRRDIKDTAGKAQQGWKGLKLKGGTEQTSEEASEVSGDIGQEKVSEASEGSPPIDPMTGSGPPQFLFSL